MKKFLNFIFISILFIFVLLIILAVLLFACTYLYSKRNNTTISAALIDLKSISNEFVDSTFHSKNSINIDGIEDLQTNNDEPESSEPIKYKTSRYYYNQLDSDAKYIYESLEKNVNNLKKENFHIDFSNKFNDLLHESTGEYKLNKSFQSALDAFFYEHPELFYIDLTKISLNIKCVSIGPVRTYTTKISPSDNKNYLNDYFKSQAEVEIAIEKVENVKNNFLNEFKNLNDYKKILQIHNALAESLEYDSSMQSPNIHNIYGGLISKKVVCEGYAKAFKYLLDAFNIESILVAGTAINSSNESESHMWNYVKINDKWYGVDVTWDDPIIIGGSSKNNVRQDYLLKGSSVFLKNHYPSGKLSENGILFSIPSLSKSHYIK